MDRNQRVRKSSTQSSDNEHFTDTHGCESRATDHSKREENVPLSEPMSWYPPVAPPVGNKKDIFHSEKFHSIDVRARDTPRELNKSYSELLTFLTSGLTSDLEKVRALFVWMGVKDIVNSLDQYSSYPSASSPEYLMRKAAEGDNSSFVNLFTTLCRKAQVPCMTVTGRVKAAAYQPGRRSTCGRSTWTVVHVGATRGWRFVHPLWAFKGVKNYNPGLWTLMEDTGKATREKSKKDDGTPKGQMDEFWFLTDPEYFNFLCHPEDPGRQLLESPWTEEVFLNLPGLKADLFKSPWKFLRPHKAVVETKHGKCSIDFQHPEEGRAEVRYKLFFDEDNSSGRLQMERCITTLKTGNGQVSLISRLPVVGLYKLEVSGVYNGVVSLLGHFCLNCTEISEAPKPFPSNPEKGFGFDQASKTAGIDSPSQTEGVMLVDRGQMLDFSFQVDEDLHLKPQLKHGLKRSEDLNCHITVTRHHNQVKIGVELPTDDASPEYALEIYVGGRGRGPRGQQGRDHDSEDSARGVGTGRGEGGGGGKNRLPAIESEICNNYKYSNSQLDPVTEIHNKNSNDSSNSNSSSSSNMGLEEPEVSSCSQTGRSGGGGGRRDTVADMQEDLVNAVNYLLTSDKELHDETSSEMKELHRELQEALASDEEARIREAMRRFLEAKQEDPVAEAKVKAKEKFWWQTRERLHTATEEQSLGRVNRVLEDFTSHRMEDTGELQPVVEHLMSLSERDVKTALASRSLQKLGTILRRVRNSHVGRQARATPWFREAQCLHTNETVRALCEECVEKVRPAAVLSLGDRPLNRSLMAVLRATLCLLGEEENNFRSGQGVKNKLRETNAGKSRLLDRIKTFQVERITKSHFSKARKELHGCNADTLEKDSGVTARQLHDWCKAMVKELDHHVWEEENEEEEEEEEIDELKN
ncbi:uncharacterized protein LOC143298096 isoform X2 [Babylonia areolata]|uniref:uncharacterized protein LOC143298096 isoform X2 n=1 Tax=Babylonia areolata TaxID=304850 RepID=UPI003FD10237